MDNMEVLCLACGRGRYEIKRTWLVKCMNCGFEMPRYTNEDIESLERWAEVAIKYFDKVMERSST